MTVTPLFAAVELWFDADIDAWPLVMASLIAVGCALLGAVFVVRRTALLGDAVSHSVLPGVAAGLLLSGLLVGHSEGGAFGMSTSMLFILAGALIAGLLSTAMIEALSSHSRIKPDTALGAVFPAFFAAGVILIRSQASDAHFDVDCVFYGSLENIDNARQVMPTMVSTVLVVLFFALAYKEILITSFDRELSRSLGLRFRLINVLLIALLAMTVVSAFEAVGAILVIAFLIVPPATATLLVDRFHRVLLLSMLFGLTAAFFGSWLTILLGNVDLDTARAPSVAVTAGVQFLVAFTLSPKHGLVATSRRARSLRRRILEENLLAAVYRIEAPDDRKQVGLEEAALALDYPTSHLRSTMTHCIRRGELVGFDDGRMCLTDSGRSRVETIIRARRLWESYMITEMGAAPDHAHDAADRIEHHLQPGLVRDLEELLDRPQVAPRGPTIRDGSG